MNTQNTINGTTDVTAPRSAEEPIRVPSVREHMLRAFGFMREQSLYGVEGDLLAARYPERTWNWALGYDQPIPLFLEQSRQNQAKAYCALIAMTIVGLFLIVAFLRSDPNDTVTHARPPAAPASPAEQFLMSTVQQGLGVSDKAMKDFYHPPAPQAPAPQPAMTQQFGAPTQQHHPQSLRTFGLRGHQEQYAMPAQQQQYATPAQQQQYAMPAQQQQYAMPTQQQQYAMPMQAGQPQRMQVYTER